MSDNMEIKKGQIWRNVHGEVEIGLFNAGIVYFTQGDKMASRLVTGSCSRALAEHVFRMTHEFVRDAAPEIAAPEIRVLGWVVSKHGGRPRQITAVVPNGSNGNVHLAAFGINESVGIRQFWSRYEPCDPPPLHKALREAEKLPAYASDRDIRQALDWIVNLYRKGER